MVGKRVSAVELQRVGHLFGGTAALRAVSARFVPGKAHLIVGANGSGKTTLLRIVSSLLHPSFGRVFFEGVAEAEVRATMGWVSHESLAYPDLTGRENLELAADLFGVGRAAADSAAARFGIAEFGRRPIRTMSRGQRQRVALARALMHSPSLVLLDEPTTGLDSDGVAIVRRLVVEEVAQDHIVVVVTHDPVLFDDQARSVWRLVHGRLEGVEDCGPECCT